MANTLQNDLFSSLVSDLKTYSGKDPLIPWLRGIRKMRESLPPQLLKEKLPRFLQKCVQTFKADRHYRNDLRYIRVWIQLMDFIDDPRVLLRTMEMNRIGMKRALFYQAYALYYEKFKKFEDAEKMYRLGVQNLAEPANELQKSYEQFLHRMELYKKKRMRRQEGRAAMRPLNAKDISLHCRKIEENKENIWRAEDTSDGNFLETDDHKNVETAKVTEESSDDMRKDNLDPAVHPPPNNLGNLVNSCDFGIASDPSIKGVMGIVCPKYFSKQRGKVDMESDEPKIFCNDDTVVVKFVDTAIVGKSEAEDACHHGLVDPTINMKEAMNAINSMFREPIELELGRKRSHRTQPTVEKNVSNGFEVFIDENLDNGVGSTNQKEHRTRPKVEQNVSNGFEVFIEENLDNGVGSTDQKEEHRTRPKVEQNVSNGFEVFIDENLDNGVGSTDQKEENDFLLDGSEFSHPGNSALLPQNRSELQQPCQETLKIFIDDEDSNDLNDNIDAFVFPSPKDLPQNGSDDPNHSVVCRFMGSTILDEPEVENACHHGLVDPTINLKEAMDDINSMFGKPLDFVKTNRPKKRDKLSVRKGDYSGFSILPDEVVEYQQGRVAASSSDKMSSECDLFEPTVFTKEAMDEINEMFGMPLDF